MIIIRAVRASAILYNLLTARRDRRPWLMPANICPIVPVTFFKARMPFEFVDISEITLNMDLDLTSEKLAAGTYGGILYAHTYGEDSTPNEFFSGAKMKQQDLLLVDDRCLCVPDLDPVPSNCADVMLYSTGYAKIAELKNGGYAFLKEGVPYAHAQVPYDPIQLYDLEKSYKSAIAAQKMYQYRESNWLDTSLNLPSWYYYRQQIERRLNETIAHRSELNRIYSASLPEEIQLPEKFQNWRFNLRVDHQSKILEAIFGAGLFASKHYADLTRIMATGEAPHASRLAGQVVNLFNDHHFSQAQAESVCRIIMESS